MRPSPFVGGVALSLGLNMLAFVLVSLLRQPTLLERTQAAAFVGDGPLAKSQAFRLWRASATVGDIEATVARFIGAARARRSFDALVRRARRRRSTRAPRRTRIVIRHAEHLLSPVIGASTSRLVLSLLLRRRAMSGQSALKMLDDASAAMQSSRDMLQHALDHARQGISVFDANLALVAWNRAFAELFDLPPAMLREGLGLDAIVRYNAARGALRPGRVGRFRRRAHRQPARPRRADAAAAAWRRSACWRCARRGCRTAASSRPTPTSRQTVAFEDELAAANEGLERRVGERTAELERLNQRARAAPRPRPRTPTSPRRAFSPPPATTCCSRSTRRGSMRVRWSRRRRRADRGARHLARNVDASLEAVEEILGALLDISRLDAGATRPEIGDVALADMFRQLEIEFAPMARAKGLKLTFVATRLRRALGPAAAAAAVAEFRLQRDQIHAARARAGRRAAARRDACGSRSGTPASAFPKAKRAAVFEEFHRLDQGAKVARGLGLGLSIVQRLGRVLGHPIELTSEHGRGSVFSGRGAAQPRGARRQRQAAGAGAGAPPIRLTGLRVLAIDNEPRVLEGMRTLHRQMGLPGRDRRRRRRGADAARSRRPTSSSPIITSTTATGSRPSPRCGARLGAAIPAVLATADRSVEVRDACAAADVALLNKPVKPAPLARAADARAVAETGGGMTQLTLYDFDLDEDCYRVRLALGLLGLKARLVAVDRIPGAEP